MKREYLVAMLCVFALSSAIVCAGTIFDGGWRVSVGAAYNAPTSAHLKFSPVKFRRSGQISTVGVVGRTKDEAMAIVTGQQDSSNPNKYYLTADKMVFYDKTDYAGDGSTWNAQVKADTWNGSSFEVASAEYTEITGTADGSGTLHLEGADEAAMPGIFVELSRNLYHDEDYHWGIDIAFMFSYFFKTEIFQQESQVGNYQRNGVLTSELTPMDAMDPYQIDSDGYYGSGSYYGAGPMFYPELTIRDSLGSSKSLGNMTSFSAYGNFRDLEMILAVRPYYDIYDWWRIYGTLGPAVSWSGFSLNMDCTNGESNEHHIREYDQWDVYGIGGLGMLFRWEDFTIGFDFFARFFNDDIDVRDELVHGSVDRGRWVFRGMIGYEF